jgi:3-hydroxyisobutyrate dehydrogenase-like beta-hydroxyacid dehydrogenase
VNIGILHPGQMGIVVAVSAKNSGNEVYWASEGRRAASADRARAAGLSDALTIENLCATCSIVISVCPPEFADDVARQVAGFGFRGVFADVNAVSPARVKRIARTVTPAGADFVDGGIIGTPTTPNGPWLYLSGSSASKVAECFRAGPLVAEVIKGDIGAASALKMCFAAYNKGATALMASVIAAAQELGVWAELERQWTKVGPPGYPRELLRATPKAWRFIAEMHEIADTFESAGVGRGFHESAAEIYERLRGFKDAEPSLEEVVKALASAHSTTEAPK